MHKDQLMPILDKVMPKTANFAFALTGEELAAEQLVIDAYTVFLMENKSFLAEEEYDFGSGTHRKSFSKYLFKEMVREVFELAIKRANLFSESKQELGPEYENFYKLNLMKRAVLYLKEMAGFGISDLQEVFAMNRAQVIEVYYNAKHEVLTANNQPEQRMS